MNVWVRLDNVWHMRIESSHTACRITYDASNGPVFRRVDTWLPCDNVTVCPACVQNQEIISMIDKNTDWTMKWMATAR